MTAKTRKPFNYKILIIVLCSILAVILALVGAFFIFIKVGEKRLREKLSYSDYGMTEDEAYGDYAEVFHNGQGYVYNENIINILCIGVDKDNPNNKNYRQADAIYLLSLDTEANVMNVITISRNSLTDIDIYDMNNEYMATEKAQICLSYVYGKDDTHSTLLTCRATSRLLYNIPINAYYTLFMDSVDDLVNAVGGVEVVMPDDMTDVNKSWTKGKKIKLKGKEALRFVQYREETHSPRLERQKLFINSFVNAAKKAITKNASLPGNLYNKLLKNSVTDLDASQVTYLATEMVDAKFQMHSIKGNVGFDGMYETFEVDDEALFETVLDLFYIKTN